MRDVIVVGAGLAGLATADALRHRDVLLIEQGPNVGGRVRTRQAAGVTYELGALFRYDPELIAPSRGGSAVIRETAPIGFNVGGVTYTGNSVSACMLAFADAFPDGSTAPTDTRHILNAFFRVIHPGDLTDYLACRQRDALERFCTDHVEAGNVELSEALARGATHDLLVGAEVIEVRDTGEAVQVVYRQDGRSRSVMAAAVVVATPAGPCARMLTTAHARTRSFLDRLSYGSGGVLVLGLRGATLPEYAYVVALDLPFNTVVQWHTRDEALRILTIYFVGSAARAVEREPRTLVDACRVELGRAGLASFSVDQICFTDSAYWSELGSLITAASYASWDDAIGAPSRRVRLAGDYVFVETDRPMPYGMRAAVLSGRRAAAAVDALLADTLVSTKHG